MIMENDQKMSVHESRIFQSLDALRGLAAILILFRHTTDKTLEYWFRGSYLSVDLFFILSGFVLAHAYQAKLKGELAPIRFMLLRYVRIMPLYLIALAIEIILTLCTSITATENLRLFVTATSSVLILPTIPTYSTASWALFPLNFPAWSLFFELAANFVFAVFAPAATWRSLAFITGVSALALFAASWMYGTLNHGLAWADWPVAVVRVTFGFSAGVAVYELWKLRPNVLILPTWLLLIAFILMTLVPAGGRLASFLDPAIVVFCFGPLVYLATNAHVGRLLTPVLTALGVCSYGVYVLQVPIIHFFKFISPYLTGSEMAAHGVIRACVTGVLLTGLVMVLHHFYDVPVRSAVRRSLQKR